MINSFFTNIKKDLNDFLAYAHPNLHEAIRLHIIRVDKIHQEWKKYY